MKLILASTSKFKSEILNKVNLKHLVLENYLDENNTTIDEVLLDTNNVYEYVKELALGKAKSIDIKVNDAIILGLDTVVYIDDKILEKPKSLSEARYNINLCKNVL